MRNHAIVARFVRLDGTTTTKRILNLSPSIGLNPGDFGEPFEPPVQTTDLINFELTEERHHGQPVYREVEGAGWVPPVYPGRPGF